MARRYHLEVNIFWLRVRNADGSDGGFRASVEATSDKLLSNGTGGISIDTDSDGNFVVDWFFPPWLLAQFSSTVNCAHGFIYGNGDARMLFNAVFEDPVSVWLATHPDALKSVYRPLTLLVSPDPVLVSLLNSESYNAIGVDGRMTSLRDNLLVRISSFEPLSSLRSPDINPFTRSSTAPPSTSPPSTPRRATRSQPI